MNNFFSKVFSLFVILFVNSNCFADVTWKTVWIDHFEGVKGSLPSSSNWRFDLGTSYPNGPANWGTNEVESYTNSTDNISLDGNSNLVITPLLVGNTWTSARIETNRDDFRPSSGCTLAIEGKIQMPNVSGDKALGYWPAFWALGAPLRQNYNSWPAVGEYDILENVNGINRVWGTLHCGVNPGGPCHETDGLGNYRPCPGLSCQSAFHVYRFEWDDALKEFRWYVDGQQYHRVTRDQIGSDIWDQVTGHGYFILLNVAMGGGFPNGVSGKTTPTSATEPGHPMLIDYVAVYTS